MKQRQIFINAVMSLCQVVMVGLSLFFLYRFLLRSIGIERLGLWSVVLATTSIANVANMGISASVVRFVAKFLARGEQDRILVLIQTSVISLAVAMGCGLAAAYPLAKWLLSLVILPANLEDALRILPFGLISLWITMIAAVYQAGLDGFQRIDQRSILIVGSAWVFLFSCILIVPKLGLLGVAYAQVVNSFVVLGGSWLMLRRHIVALPIFPRRWRRDIFREIVGYSMNIQVISIFSMLYDPVTKSLLARYGGLSFAGFYDMANRMVLQLRSLIVSASQVFVPAVADLQENNSSHVRVLYKEFYRVLILISLPLFVMVMAVAPAVSEVWIGHYEGAFVFYSVVLSFAWFANSLTVPAYFFNLGLGELRWNVASHIVIGVLNATLGVLLGVLYGGKGVVLAWAFSLSIGSFIISISFHHKNNLPLKEIVHLEDLRVFVGSLAGLLLSILYYGLAHRLVAAPLLILLVFVPYFGCAGIPIWRHPMRVRLAQWIDSYLLSPTK